MATCEGCGGPFEPRSSRHRFCSAQCRKTVQWQPRFGPNREALEQQVAAMATGPEHLALVEACRCLADVVDYYRQLGGFDEKAWREYRLALEALGKAVKRDSSSPSFESLLEQLRAQVPDAPDG